MSAIKTWNDKRDTDIDFQLALDVLLLYKKKRKNQAFVAQIFAASAATVANHNWIQNHKWVRARACACLWVYFELGFPVWGPAKNLSPIWVVKAHSNAHLMIEIPAPQHQCHCCCFCRCCNFTTSNWFLVIFAVFSFCFFISFVYWLRSLGHKRKPVKQNC